MQQSSRVPFIISTRWPEFNEGFEYKDYIKREFANYKLLDFYAQKHKQSGEKETWLERIRNRQITVNGQVAPEDYVLKVSDVLSYRRLPWREPPAPDAIEVLFSSKTLVVLNKPPGLQVLPGAFFHQRTVLTLLQGHAWPAETCEGAKGGDTGDIRKGDDGIINLRNSVRDSDDRRFAKGEQATTSASNQASGKGKGEKEGEGGADELGVLESCASQVPRASSPDHLQPPPPQQRRAETTDDGAGRAVKGLSSASCVSASVQTLRQPHPHPHPHPQPHGQPQPCVVCVSTDTRDQSDKIIGDNLSRQAKAKAKAKARRTAAATVTEVLVPSPVHRLGRGTSGLLLCARTKEARQALTKALEDKTTLAEDWETFLRKERERDPSTNHQMGFRPHDDEMALSDSGGGDGAPHSKGAIGKHSGRDPTATAAVPSDSGSKSGFIGLSASHSSGPGAPSLDLLRRFFRSAHVPGEFGSGYDGGPASESGSGDERAIRKIYLAVVEGIVPEDEGLVDACIGPVPFEGVRGGVYAASESGKPALSVFRVVRRSRRRNCSLLEVEIFSGRPHQIRIHCASMGHPLTGDPLYLPGGKPKLKAVGACEEGSSVAETINSCDSPESGSESGAGAGTDANAGQKKKVSGMDMELDPCEVRPGSIGYLLHAYRVRIQIQDEEPMWLTAPPPPEIQELLDMKADD